MTNRINITSNEATIAIHITGISTLLLDKELFIIPNDSKGLYTDIEWINEVVNLNLIDINDELEAYSINILTTLEECHIMNKVLKMNGIY